MLTSATDTTADTTKILLAISILEMQVLRTIQGILLSDKVRNTTIRKSCVIQDIKSVQKKKDSQNSKRLKASNR